MKSEHPRPLTELELEIMQVIWDLERCTVRDVHTVLQKRRQVAYTTVMTMMNILEEKGHLLKTKRGRAFEYTPTRARQAVITSMVDDFITRVFRGSARPLVVGLAKDRRLTAEDLAEIERILKEEA